MSEAVVQGEGRRPRSRLERLGDGCALLGLALITPTALAAFSIEGPIRVMTRVLGPFGEPGTMLLCFMACFLVAALFGTVRKALPVLSGLAAGLLILGGAFELPRLEFLRSALFRFELFSEPWPGLFAGLVAMVSGNLLGRSARAGARLGLFMPPSLALAVLLGLTALDPFPDTADARALDAASVDSALSSMAKALGKEYVSPGVETAVKRIMAQSGQSLADKEKALEELAGRLVRAEADKAALERSLRQSGALASELEAAKRSLEEMKGLVDEKTPLVKGGRYDQAVQPADPLVRDFAVKAASAAPGAWDKPQGSRLPNAAGARQLALVHAAVSSSWKYVSDPAVSWTDYTSPARRSLLVGLAGDCDDYATVMASAIIAVGGRARIMHGYKGSSGHAWAEVWLGSGREAESILRRVAEASGRGSRTLACSRDAAGNLWLVLDWELGRYSLEGATLSVAWEGRL